MRRPSSMQAFPEGVEARSVVAMGWASKKNGELVRLASSHFDVLFTVDQNMRFQTNLIGVDLCVAVAPSNLKNVADFQPYVTQIASSAERIAGGEYWVMDAQV